MVHPQIGDAIPHREVEPAVRRANIVQGGADDGQTDVAQEDQLRILGLIQRAGRVEVVDTAKVSVALALATAFGLAFVVVVASHVGEEVQGPPEQLLQEHVDDRSNGGLLHQLVELMDGLADTGGILVTGLGDEDHVAGDVTGSLVVLAVGDLPGEVRHEKGGVADEANRVVQHLGGREGLVTTLVSQHPDTGADHTLDDGIQSPEPGADGQGRNVLRSHIVVEGIEDGGQDGDIPEDIVQAGPGLALVAVGGNGITDLLDGVVGDLELIAIGVEELGGSLGLGVRGHGRQGGRRGGLPGALQRRGGDGGNGRVGPGVAVQRHALRDRGGRHDALNCCNCCQQLDEWM